MKKQNILFNPFIRIAGWQAFAIGFPIAIITSIVAVYSHLAFDGLLDAHSINNIDIKTSLILLLINVVSGIFIMYLAALIISKKTRFIDILGTMTFARAPFILAALAGFFVTPVAANEIMKNPMIVLSQSGFIPFTILLILASIWMIVLTFNAFKTSTGGKGVKLVLTFIIAILAAEVLSKILIHYVLRTSIFPF